MAKQRFLSMREKACPSDFFNDAGGQGVPKIVTFQGVGGWADSRVH